MQINIYIQPSRLQQKQKPKPLRFGASNLSKQKQKRRTKKFRNEPIDTLNVIGFPSEELSTDPLSEE